MQIAQVTIGLEIRRQIEVPHVPQIIDHQTALPLVEEDAETNKSFFGWLETSRNASAAREVSCL